MKLKNGIEIVSMDQRLARVRLRAPFGAGQVGADAALLKKLTDPKLVSQWGQTKNDNFNFENVNDVMPKDGDYITVKFRALSKTVVPGHWIDWTKDNVLEDSVPLLLGATVYPNHDFFDINNWLGSVAQVAWDEAGANAENVPGINAEYKIDALMNPRIARGLLMTPPAIHSTSMTVLFEFEYSHPEMAAENKWKFIQNLGEEIDGQIVRFIVTKIREYWEASLVFQGADRLAKQYDEDGESITGDDDDDFDDESLAAAGLPSPISNEEKKTMKLNKEQKQSLGIEIDGDEVPDEQVFAAIDSLSKKAALADGLPDNVEDLKAQAAAGATLVTQKREEVTRLAKLAELGADEGTLDEVVSNQIENADADGLIKLETYFGKKVAEKFPKNGRSSLEDHKEIDNAGGVGDSKTIKRPKAGLL